MITDGLVTGAISRR